MSSSREAQRRYRSKQKAKLEDLRVEVEGLKTKLVDLDLKRAGLASQNRILEETAAAVQAKNQKEAEKAKDPPRTLWDESTGKSLAEFFNKIRGDSLVAEMGAEEGRTLSTSELILLVQEFYSQLTEVMTSSMPHSMKNRNVARLITAKGEIRHALERMGPKYTALLQLGADSSSIAKDQPPPSKALIQQGLDSLQLSDIQKNELITGKNKLLRRFAEIKAERVEIIEHIHEVIERDRDKGDEQQSAMTLLEEVDATEELRRNLNQEHTCFFRFQSELHETLTPLQFAMALALKQLNGVSMWLMIQLLSTQTSSAPCGSDEQPTASPGVRKTAPPTSCHQGVAQPASASGADGNGGRETSQNSSDTSLLDGPFVPDGHAYAYNGNLSPETHQQSGVSSGLASAGNGSAHPHAGPQHSLKHSEQAAEDMLSDMPHPLELNFDEGAGSENDQNIWKFFQDIFGEEAF